MNHRILFVTETLFPLGAAQQLKILAESLVELGHDVNVAVLGERSPESTNWIQAGIGVFYLNGDDTTPLHTLRDGLYVVQQLRKLIRQTTPEIVHTWCGQAELLTLLATMKMPILEPLHRFRLLSTELFLQPEKQFLRMTIENQLDERVEQMIVPHLSVKQHLIENGYREQRISIVPNAIPPKKLERDQARRNLLQKLNLPEGTYLAGAVAPLAHRTRLKDLIWATDMLSCIRNDFHFLIIGKGTQLNQLKRFAALTAWKDHVHFLGHPESPEQIVAGLDFYWHSHLQDPLSGNLLAAMGSGVPSISVYGPGTEEIIRHQETGFAVNFGARDEFARWTKFIIEQQEPAKKLARQGQEFARKQFPKSRMIDGYLAIYNSEN